MDNVQGAVHKDSIDGFPMSFRGLKGGTLVGKNASFPSSYALSPRQLRRGK